MELRQRLMEGHARYIEQSDAGRRRDTAERGQHPYAIVVACSDSRVIPEQIFDADLGDLFVVRVAGNVLGHHQLGSVEYAVDHLHCRYILVLGHTGCGAVAAALSGGGQGYVKFITDDILKAIGEERDPNRACGLNVRSAVSRLKGALAHGPAGEVTIEGAIYDIRTGAIEWLD